MENNEADRDMPHCLTQHIRLTPFAKFWLRRNFVYAGNVRRHYSEENLMENRLSFGIGCFHFGIKRHHPSSLRAQITLKNFAQLYNPFQILIK
jgi:hypothetical protein